MEKIKEVDLRLKIGSNPYCVDLIQAWVQHGHLYLQMELCQGGNLLSYLDEHCRIHPMDEVQLWHMLAEIALVCI